MSAINEERSASKGQQLHDERLRRHLEDPPATVRSNLNGRAALVSRLTPQQARLPLRTGVTRLIGPRSRRQLTQKVAQKRATGESILLHVGCGTENKPGYINIDLVGARVDIPLDLAQGIPLPDQSVDGIFHEHVLEHLPLRVGYLFLKECLRVLRPGGILRVCVPDAGACIDSYAGKISSDWADQYPVPIMAIEDLFYGHKHVAMYDATKLVTLMRTAGFREVAERAYGDTGLEPVPDTPKRSAGGLRVEGVR